MAVEVFMPKMSDHMENGEIIRWLVKEGDPVEEQQVIMELMTDKVVAELEAPASGVLKGIRPGAEDGTVVPVGETFAFIAEPDEEVPVLSPLTPVEAKEEPVATPAPASAAMAKLSTEPAKAEGGRVRTTPVAQRLAKELGIDLSQVAGTGPGGRIREEDVRAYAEAQKQAAPPEGEGVRASPLARRLARELGVDLAGAAGTGPRGSITDEDVRAYAETVSPAPGAAPAEEDIEWLDLNPIQRVTGQRMLESIQTAPQFSLTTTVDMTNVLWLRDALMERMVAETGDRLSITAILTRIVATALEKHPRANASFEGGRVKVKRQVNVGVAIGTDDGLVVPVIKGADQKPLPQIIQALRSFQDKAQRVRFTSDDLMGGTFTLSNLGMYGIDRFDAIINPPQSAILAVGRVVKTPVGMPDDTVALRPIMSLTLTIDHRVMDGVQGAKFLTEIKELIEEPYFLL
jgi:pyruvate dehydrogenase E2 component (dihydrolipoamide acetyltransferase)